MRKKLIVITAVTLSLLIIFGLFLIAFYGSAYQKIGRIIKYANSTDLTMQSYDNLWVSYDELQKLKFVDQITNQQTIMCDLNSNIKFKTLLEFEVSCNVVLRVWNITKTGYVLDKEISGTRNISFRFENSQWTISNVEIIGVDDVEVLTNESEAFSKVLY